MKLFIGLTSMMIILLVAIGFYHDVVNYRKAKNIQEFSAIEELQIVRISNDDLEIYSESIKKLKSKDNEGDREQKAKIISQIEGRMEIVKVRLKIDLEALRELNRAKINKLLESNFMLKSLKNQEQSSNESLHRTAK